jgi:hypothetical protein
LALHRPLLPLAKIQSDAAALARSPRPRGQYIGRSSRASGTHKKSADTGGCLYRKPHPIVMPRPNRLSWRDDRPVPLCSRSRSAMLASVYLFNVARNAPIASSRMRGKRQQQLITHWFSVEKHSASAKSASVRAAPRQCAVHTSARGGHSRKIS